MKTSALRLKFSAIIGGWAHREDSCDEHHDVWRLPLMRLLRSAPIIKWIEVAVSEVREQISPAINDTDSFSNQPGQMAVIPPFPCDIFCTAHLASGA